MRSAKGIALSLIFVITSTAASAEDLVIGFADHSAPYVMPDNLDPGISVEIVREAFRIVGLDIKPAYQSYKRIKEQVRQGRLDGAAGAMPEGEEGLYFSEPCIAFDNVAIVRKNDGIEISGIADLPGHRVVAWQNAHDHLGGEFQQLFGDHVRDDYVQRYYDLADQVAQVRMFWSERADVIVIDDVIFDYMTSLLADDFEIDQDLERHRIFGGLTVFSVAFSDKTLRDQFNRGLAKLRQSGAYDAIYEKYRRVKQGPTTSSQLDLRN